MSLDYSTEAAGRAAVTALAGVLDLLAEHYLEPRADLRAEAAGLAADQRLAAPALAGVMAALEELSDAPGSELDVEYVRLFLHGRPATAHPYESYYRSGRLADEDCVSDLESLLAAAGVEPEGAAVPVDHLGIELDLLALLLAGLADDEQPQPARREIAEIAERLLADHLVPFAAAFLERLEQAAPEPYYRAGAAVLQAALAAAPTVLAVVSEGSDAGPLRPVRNANQNQPLTRHKEDTMRSFTVMFALAALLAVSPAAVAQEPATPDPEAEAAELRAQLEEIEGRLDEVEMKSAKDRVNFNGDLRVEAHSIATQIPAHFDGMMLQNLMVNTMFYYGANGQFPPSLDAVGTFIAQNYADYLYFTDNLTFADLQQALGMFPPEMQQALFQFLLPATAVDAYDWDNSLMYTTRLRLGIDAKVYDNVKFTGRLSMYKTWGDSTGVQVFNGQSNSFNIDGNTSNVPNSDILRVERAYFDWTDIGGSDFYLSIGRRPSTGGPPLHLRDGELRAGSPMGSLIDFQFDGITVGYHIGESSTARICYGRGYESGYGSGEQLVTPADRLEDADFAGLNWDIWQTDDMLVQVTIARAFNLTDGFNGLIVLPDNPVTGQPIGAPLVMRYTPAANLGDMDIAGILLMRRDGPIDWFVNFNYNKSHPDPVTTPFGGLLSDPFETPEEHSGSMYYLGARYNFNNDKTMIGLEYNHGSEYWFNFTPAQDDIIAAKTNTRGDVIEAYLLHWINKNFMFRFGYTDYSYDYSGSGWHIGAPKPLDEMPILGYPTYESASVFSAAMTARF